MSSFEFEKELRVTETGIPGLKVVDLPVHGDARGWFKENWQRAKMVAAGLPDFRPVQNNVSFNASRGVTRGIHAEPWDKFISVATGSVFGAWVDLRPGAGFGQVFTCTLDPSKAIYVPRGVGNSYQALEDGTAYTVAALAETPDGRRICWAANATAPARLRVRERQRRCGGAREHRGVLRAPRAPSPRARRTLRSTSPSLRQRAIPRAIGKRSSGSTWTIYSPRTRSRGWAPQLGSSPSAAAPPAATLPSRCRFPRRFAPALTPGDARCRARCSSSTAAPLSFAKPDAVRADEPSS